MEMCDYAVDVWQNESWCAIAMIRKMCAWIDKRANDDDTRAAGFVVKT